MSVGSEAALGCRAKLIFRNLVCDSNKFAMRTGCNGLGKIEGLSDCTHVLHSSFLHSIAIHCENQWEFGACPSSFLVASRDSM